MFVLVLYEEEIKVCLHADDPREERGTDNTEEGQELSGVRP